MKKKQVLALGMAAALTVSMSSGTVSLAAEADIGRQSTVEVTEKGDGENAVTVNDVKSVEENIEVNAENFPDEAFREYVSGRFDKDGDGVLSPEEIENAAQESEETYRYSTNTAEMYLMDAGGDRIEAKEPVEPEEVEDGKKSCVLLVEDNADIQKYLSQGLSAYFRVLRASNGKEALEILEENEEVNLILSDVMMPVMDGIKLCRQVKRNLKFCHIPLIMLSARSDVKDQLEGLQTGADDYIPKPFLLEMVIAKIRNLLRTYRQAVEHYSKSMEIEPEKVALNPLDEEFLRKAMETVKRHLDDISFSADAFAGEMNMSRSTLHLKMKAVTGESTMDFIRKIRFGEACRLLKEGRYNVTEISEMVGFNTPSYFATSFKKYVGCLPSEYVKMGE